MRFSGCNNKTGTSSANPVAKQMDFRAFQFIVWPLRKCAPFSIAPALLYLNFPLSVSNGLGRWDCPAACRRQDSGADEFITLWHWLLANPAHDFSRRREMILPRPEGEGRGEGERGSRVPSIEQRYHPPGGYSIFLNCFSNPAWPLPVGARVENPARRRRTVYSPSVSARPRAGRSGRDTSRRSGCR
jgi:hypothetical protein